MNQHPPLRFKQQDGTPFPEWTTKTTTELCARMVSGDTPDPTNPSYYQGSIPWISAGDVDKGDIYTVRYQKFISEEAIAHSGAKKVKAGSIAVVLRVVPGKVVIVERTYCTSKSFVSLEDPTEDREFLAYMLAKRLEHEKHYAQGTAQKSIKLQHFQNLKHQIPASHEEQHKIASLITAVNHIIHSTKHELHAMQAQRKAISAALLHGTLRFSPTTKWAKTKMSELFSLSVGSDLRPKSYSPKQDASHPYPIYANTSDKNAVYGYANYYQHEGNTLTVTARGSVGHAIARHHKYVATGRLLVCTPKSKEDQDCLDFFAHLINHTTLQTEWTAVPKLTAAQLSCLKLQRPPRSEQQRIATAISAMEDAIAHEKAELSAWQDLKRGLMQQLLP